ncbi:SGNH hydrolase-type esterase domain-containing protein [Xylariaceae sp. FL0594]|nr:SGNH hydrolase-type esterase domain-containing protein [Xylariaceae sp. FL0594]
MGASMGEDWRNVMGTARGRKISIIFAFVFITVSFIVYGSHRPSQTDANYYNEGGSGSHRVPASASPPKSTESSPLPGEGVVVTGVPQASGSAIASSPLVSASPSFAHNNSASLVEPLREEPSTTSNWNVPGATQISSALGATQRPLAGGVPLRVMFLGASVTRGDVSIGNLGFRSPLRDRLSALGNPINFVGSQRLGAFKDNDVEAYKGNRIDQIHEHATHIVPQTKPNVFVLHVGSNDCLQRLDTAHAGKRMRDLVNYLLRQSPRATIILSTLLTNTVPSKEPCILDINVQIRRLASELQREGRAVVLAEMHCEQGLPDRPLPVDISPDGTHPFDHGYRLMADIFFDAFLEADKRGFFMTPEEKGIPDDGELERADEPLMYEPEPLPGMPAPAKEEAKKEKATPDKNKDVPPPNKVGDITMPEKTTPAVKDTDKENGVDKPTVAQKIGPASDPEKEAEREPGPETGPPLEASAKPATEVGDVNTNNVPVGAKLPPPIPPRGLQ